MNNNVDKYLTKLIKECREEIQRERLFETLRPVIREHLLNEKTSKHSAKKLVAELMDNPTTKKEIINYIQRNQKDFSEIFNSSYGKADGQKKKGSNEKSIKQRLKNPIIDMAPLAEKEFPQMTPDGARSKLSHLVNGYTEMPRDLELDLKHDLDNV